MEPSDIRKQLLKSRRKTERLTAKLMKERELQEALLAQLGSDATIEIPVKTKNVNPQYNRKEIGARIVELRDTQNMSFTTIAVTLNSEGFKPRSADSFSQATVYQIYKAEKKPKVAASEA